MIAILALAASLVISNPQPGRKTKCASACRSIEERRVCWYREVSVCAWYETPCDQLRDTVCLPVTVDLGEWMTLRDNDYGVVYPNPNEE